MHTSNTFGQNQWLVEEMYRRWMNDPTAVDREWQILFGTSVSTSVSPPAAELQPEKTPEVAKPVNSPSPLEKIGELPTPGATPLRGIFRTIAKNMDESLSIPTATTVRDMPARLMFENRDVINQHLRRTHGGKISFTHIIGWAVVKATQIHPAMNVRYELNGTKPQVVVPEHINLGLAIDLPQKDGSRALVVASIKETEAMSFAEFVRAYEDIVIRARNNQLKVEDYQGATISLTNPGGIGTRHSVPRLTHGQGTIVGVGAMDYPAEFAGASADRLAEVGVGKLVTLTSTYDHRIIQGAESGEFLREISRLLIDDAFYDEIFTSLHIPYLPYRWAQDLPNIGVDKNTRVTNLISAYRSRGHLMADTNPLHWNPPGLPIPDHHDLLLSSHGLTIWDLDRTFNVGGFGGKEKMTLREVLTRLRDAYTRQVGYEYMQIRDNNEREWLQERIEAGIPKPSTVQQKYILQKLNAAEAFETFLQTKYVGQKRFSLEGAESLIPLLDAAIDTAATQKLDEVVIGMPHRGRLNVLFNIMGKPLSEIFREFDGKITEGQIGGSGDVKYHLGAEGRHLQMFGENEIAITLAANPSHLEAVNPVVEGIARAKQDMLDLGKSKEGYSVMPLLLHGDASFAGLGVVAETLNMMGLRGYTVGGTVHVVVNNQIGFTTTPDSGRSSYYATDLAKAHSCPVFHVNGDDPEAVVWVARLATEYRKRFKKDVFIDLICYRRRGHNEADDPSLTQPQMYELIRSRPTVRAQYTANLVGRGDITEEDAMAAARDFHDQMESVFNQVKVDEDTPKEPAGITSSQPLSRALDTSVTKEEILEIARAYTTPPPGHELHKRVKPVAARRMAAAENGGIDWAWAELLALSSLANEGRVVRLAGEDTRRGTFTQRHAILFDPETGEEFNPIHELALRRGNGGKFMVYNSPLTEFAGMGFEYGYSTANLDALVAWEAQFGDFANGAQTIIDEYVSSGETKWGLLSNLVLLLPHGYEGQGPDHSSARIERYLQLAAEGSMTITQPSTPANYFHLLRRHTLGKMKRPLVVFTPKSMLRDKAAVSALADFTEVKKFRSVINDTRFVDSDDHVIAPEAARKVQRIVLVTGKLAWAVEKHRAETSRDDIAVVRLEMLYPLPFNRLAEAFDAYPNATEVVFAQEEPANQGAWPFVHEHLPELIPGMPPLRRVSRRRQAASAVGSVTVHQREQRQLLTEIFAPTQEG